MILHFDLGGLRAVDAFRLSGSVLPKALVFSVPSGVLAFALVVVGRAHPDASWNSLQSTVCWSALNICVGLILSFRCSQALTRYWRGAELLMHLRTELIDFTSLLYAFTLEAGHTRQEEVHKFKSVVACLVSLLHGLGLQKIYDTELCNLEVLSGLDASAKAYLLELLQWRVSADRVVAHWLYLLIVQNHSAGLLSVPPPWSSRLFSSLDNVMCTIRSAKVITEEQFPFPFAQTIALMLLFQTVLSPFLIGAVVRCEYWAFVLTFVAVTGVWCLNLTASQLECPHGIDPHDMDLQEAQNDLNTSILMLMDARTQVLPQAHTDFTFGVASEHSKNPGKRVSVMAGFLTDMDMHSSFQAKVSFSLPDPPAVIKKKSGIGVLPAPPME